MERPTDAAVMWLRALLLAAVAFVIGAVGHVAADGMLPPFVVLVALFALTALAAAPLVRSQVRLPAMIGLLAVGQAGIHVALTASAGHVAAAGATSGGGAPVPHPVPLTGSRSQSLFEIYQATVAAPPAHGTGLVVPRGDLAATALAHGPMMAVHLGVAVLAAMWLAYGEALLWSLMTLLGRRALLPLLTLMVPPAPRRTAAWASSLRVTWSSRVGIAPLLRRGPPVLV